MRFDEPGDGNLWARGATYKAAFGPSQSLYVPFLGSSAPRNFPLAMRVQSLRVGAVPLGVSESVAPARSGSCVEFERGSWRERYDLRPDSIEQSFVFESLPERGEIVLGLALESELAVSAWQGGLRFRNEFGGIEYGRAEAFDSAGRRAECALQLAGTALELRVPADFVQTARLPLTIDPLITTFSVAGSGIFESMSDSAYDKTSGTFLVVYSLLFSGSDWDVSARQYYANGAPVPGGFTDVDISSDPWREPRVANLDYFDLDLVVASVGFEWPLGLRRIAGRTVHALSLSTGPEITIGSAAARDLFHADVGGETQAFGSWCVVWETDTLLGENDIEAQIVQANGTLLYSSPIQVDNSSANDEYPALSQSNANLAWNVVWQREYSVTDRDIYGAQVLWDGSVVPTFPIDVSTRDDFQPSCSSRLATVMPIWLAAWTSVVGQQGDIRGALLSGQTVLAALDLTALENAGNGPLSQELPQVATDGAEFALTYSEEYSSTDYDIYVSTFALAGSQLYASEVHTPVATSTLYEAQPRLVSHADSGGPVGRYVVTWDEYWSTGPDWDVQGALFEAEDFTSFCLPGYLGVIPCPCANPPAQLGLGCDNSSSTGGAHLSQTGTASLARDDVRFVTTGEKPTATSIVLQGQASVDQGAAFGQGVRCLGTNLKRLYVKAAVGGSITAPAIGDPSVSVRSAALGDTLFAGAKRYYMVYYRDPVILGGCTVLSTFNATQGGVISWRP